MMAACASGITNSPAPLDEEQLEKLAYDLYKWVKKDNLVKAKMTMKGLGKDEKKKIVEKSFEGNAPLFLAAQQGQVHFVNFVLDECGADIEQRGVYEVQEDRSRHQVTPLWCAAVANKLDVVKSLIRHGALVNATSDTQSTPVRSACYMTNIDVVKFLVENGADIHKPNMNGGTCLINSVQSVDLCKFLIDKGADVNAQDNSGNLALHYAIREGRMESVKLLMRSGSMPYVKNDFGDDAIQTAALRGYADILDFLVGKIKPVVERQVEAYDLMAANFVDEKHDIQRAIQTWRYAMDLRFKDPENILSKTGLLPINPAYQNAKEATTVDELNEIASVPDSMYMQALIIRERILGPDHKDTIFGLMYRGAVYADTHRYQRCVDLWRYAFNLRHNKKEALNHECLFTLQALCKLFWEVYEEHKGGYTNEAVQFSDVMVVFEMAVREVELAKDLVLVRPVHIQQQEEFHTILLLLLHLIHLLCVLPKDSSQQHRFMSTVYRMVRLQARGQHDQSFLHLAVDKKSSSVVEEYYSLLPNLQAIQVLLECGADVNAVDDNRNMPLHVCLGTLGNKKQVQPEVQDLQRVVQCLVASGAHVDAVNSQGVMAVQGLVGQGKRVSLGTFNMASYITLKCLAARVVKSNKITYENEVDRTMAAFIEMH